MNSGNRDVLSVSSSIVLDELLEGVLVLNIKGEVYYGNIRAANILGYEVDDMVGLSSHVLFGFSSIVKYNLPTNSKNFLDSILGTSSQLIRSTNGEFSPFHVKTVKQKVGTEEFYLLFFNKIQKMWAAKLNADYSFTILSELYQHFHEPVIVGNEDSQIVYVSKSFCRLFKISVDPIDLIGFDCSKALISDALFKSKESTSLPESLVNSKKAFILPVKLIDNGTFFLEYIPISDGAIPKGWAVVFHSDESYFIKKKKLEQNRKLHQTIFDVSSMLLKTPHSTMSSYINSSLAIIGENLGINRIFVCTAYSSKGHFYLKIRNQWAHKEIEVLSNGSLLRRVKIDSLANRFLSLFEQGEILHINGYEFDSEIQVVLTFLNIKSMVIVPVIKQRSILGYIVLEHGKTDTPFDELDETTLHMLANTIGGAMRKSSEYTRKTRRKSDLLKTHRLLIKHLLLVKRRTRTLKSQTLASSRFLANMSHELRTPMNGIVGMASLLERSNLSKDQKECVQAVKDSGNELIIIINSILDYSKIEHGKMELDVAPFSIRKCIDDMVTELIPLAILQQVFIRYSISETTPDILIGDATKLRQIIVNLIGNVVKKITGTTLTLNVEVQNSESNPLDIILYFNLTFPSNSNMALHENMDTIALTIAKTSSSLEILNISLARMLTEFIGGQFSITQNDNNSTAIILQFPIHCQHQKTNSQDSNVQKSITVFLQNNEDTLALFLKQIILNSGYIITDDRQLANIVLISSNSNKAIVSGNSDVLVYPTSSGRYVFYHFSGRSEPLSTIGMASMFNYLLSYESISSHIDDSASTSTPLPLTNPLQILVAEDNRINQLLIVKALRYFGYSCDMVSNGKEALAKIQNKRYDIVFMDVQMPEMDGIEATRHIVKELGCTEPYIIAMTANSCKADVESYLNAGMVDFISKPFKLETLANILAKWGKIVTKSN